MKTTIAAVMKRGAQASIGMTETGGSSENAVSTRSKAEGVRLKCRNAAF